MVYLFFHLSSNLPSPPSSPFHLPSLLLLLLSLSLSDLSVVVLLSTLSSVLSLVAWLYDCIRNIIKLSYRRQKWGLKTTNLSNTQTYFMFCQEVVLFCFLNCLSLVNLVVSSHKVIQCVVIPLSAYNLEWGKNLLWNS